MQTKEQRREYMRGWYARRTPEQKAKQREKARILGAKYRAENGPKVRAARRAWYMAHPEARRRVRYGLTPEQFGTMLGKQEGLCAICTEPLGHGHKTHVDHDHATNKTRGLLCHRCNRGIGQFRDSSALLIGAASYIDLHAGRV